MSKQGAKATLARQRKIQSETDRADRRRGARKAAGSGKSHKSAKTGPRRHARNPQPEQHKHKPGLERELKPRPEYLAPDYEGSGKLADMTALITGADSGIGRAVAVLYAREGADVAIVYLSSDEDAEETRAAVENEGRRCLLIKGDVTDPEFCESAVEQVVDEFGKLSRYWSTTPPSRAMPKSWKTFPRNISTRRCTPICTVISTWRKPRCRICTKATASSTPVRKPACSAIRTCWTTR
jgi:hypothetical protein